MTTYISLMNFTDKGIAAVKDTTKRAAAVTEAAAKAGMNMKVFWTLGEFDMVIVSEADDEQAMTAFGLAAAAQGNVRGRTLRAFTAKEMDAILAKLP